MKRTLARLQKLRNLAFLLEKGLSDLEDFHHKSDRHLDTLDERAALLEQASADGPAYVRERAKRLRGLIGDARGRIGYAPKNYHALFRQLDKVKNTDLVEMFSESLQKRVDRLVAGADSVKDLIVPGTRRVVLYELGGMTFAVAGRVVRYIRGIGQERIRNIERLVKPRRGSIEFFPDPADRVFFPDTLDGRTLDLVIMGRSLSDTRVPGDADYLGVFCDRLSPGEINVLAKKAERFAEPHRYVRAVVRHQGRPVYLVTF
ncbi:MAG: hypothetical protein HY042_02650 [Spirochaetia bacterium]|nr:hypothetical protein [Spirochaetia bacterium]